MTATPRCCSAPRKYLAETRNFDGTAVVIFQPAEEGGGGGREMVKDGLMERFGIQEVYGMHNMPGPAGRRLRDPPRPDAWPRPTAFIIEIEGTRRPRGAAASAASTRWSPAAQIVTGAAVDRVAQRRPARSRRVVSITQFHAGDAYNVIPQTRRAARHRAHLLPEAARPRSRSGMREIVAGDRRGLRRRRRRSTYNRDYPVTVNHAEARPTSPPRSPPKWSARDARRRPTRRR